MQTDTARMTFRRALLLLAVLTSACFRTPSDPPRPDVQAFPSALLVNDLGGASFAAARAPRDLTLDLVFAEPLVPDAEKRVLLLRGVVGPALAAQLTSTHPGAVQRARTVSLRSERRARALRLQPTDSLAAGARYTLIWQSEPVQLFALQVAVGPSFGARLVEMAPAAGQPGVPAQLTRALLRFDGAVQGELPEHIALQTARGEDVATDVTVEPCAERGLPAGDCAWLRSSAQLLPGVNYQLALSSGLSTVTGAPIAGAVVSFEVARDGASAPPGFLATPCAPDELVSAELCVRTDDGALYVRGTVSSQAFVELALGTEDARYSSATLSYASTFALQLPHRGQARALLRATDLAGRASERTLSFARAGDLAQVAIDEVRADPLGKEPAQEYVELLNFGTTPVSLMGFTLTKDVRERGRALVSALTLLPGERALAVAPDFDAHDATDGLLPAGTRLVRLEAALSLANGGDAVFLRDAEGRRVSAAHALAPLVSGQCSARLADDMRGGDEGLFELDPAGGCTPGSASFLYEQDAGAEPAGQGRSAAGTASTAEP